MGMHVEYYHLSPVILTDALFFEYNPTILVTGSASQRASAYVMAEQEMMQHLETFLIPTTVTGTYMWPLTNPVRLDHGYVHSIDRIVATSINGLCTCDVTENAACAIIRQGWGIIDVRATSYAVGAGCGSCQGYGGYYQALITYTAGLPTGVAANDKSLQMGLAKIAQIHLNEICDPGANEGGIGDPGLQSWSALGSSETRMELKVYPFGSGAIANYVARLVKHLVKIRPLRF